MMTSSQVTQLKIKLEGKLQVAMDHIHDTLMEDYRFIAESTDEFDDAFNQKLEEVLKELAKSSPIY